jgi:molecular chaperone HtpG
MTTQADPQTETHEFQAEVSRVLHLMVRSVYSESEIFLRELVSNAADASDRLRYAALTDTTLLDGDGDYTITITTDPAAGTLSIADRGIGMSRDDLISNLGTVARSGTAAFAEQMTGDAAKDVSLIGQFGVGFYAAFIVSDDVRVISRKAGSDEAWAWRSDGQSDFKIDPAERDVRGTTVTLHVRDEDKEYLEPARLRHIITTYSDHIGLPIQLAVVSDDDEESVEAETINAASALWTRPKSEIEDEQYTEFYHHVAHAADTPDQVLHYKAEGMIEYSALLYVPGAQPFDLFDPNRKPRVKLYVKRVFITDDTGELIPGYLRFIRGVVDSEDLPLNISREMLQNSPVVSRISKAVTGRVLSELEKTAEKEPEQFTRIWENFGAVLKEGIYEDDERRDALLKLARFRSAKQDGWISLADYVAAMKEDQKAIYYVSATDLDAARRSPHLEGFLSRGVDVLLFSDAVDDFWLQMVFEYEGVPLKSVTRGGSDLADLGDAEIKEDAPEPVADADLDVLIAALKENLGEHIKDVRTTDRLTDSPVCLVADDSDMDINLQRILQQQNQLQAALPRILEINPRHAVISALAVQAAEKGGMDAIADAAFLLLDQARILEGEGPLDPTEFSSRLSRLIAKS